MYILKRLLIQSQLAVLFAGAVFTPSFSSAETVQPSGGTYLADSASSESNARRPFINPFNEQRHGFWKPEVYRSDSDSSRSKAKNQSSKSKEGKYKESQSKDSRTVTSDTAYGRQGADNRSGDRSRTSYRSQGNSATNFDYINQYPVRLEKSAPTSVAMNEPYNYDYRVIAKENVDRVVVEEQIPSGTVYVSSDPVAEVNGDKVKWTLYNLEEGQEVPLRLTVKPTRVGELSSCATIMAYQQACTTTSVGVPELTITKTTSKEQVLLGSQVPWNITVTNTGNYVAQNVVVKDTLPAGLTHESGQRSITSDVGTLDPGQSRDITVLTNASTKGRHCNEASVSASNAQSAQDDACIQVVQAGLEVVKKGTKRQFVGKKASYEIKATNTGDLPLTDVVLTDTVPPQNRLLSAPGATVEGNTATWNFDLPAGKSKDFKVNVLGLEGGTYCNQVVANSAQYSLSDNSEACTEWTGHPALLIEVIDTNDPLLAGDKTTYIIKITNQGTARDTNVGLDVTVQPEMKLVSASGSTNGVITGNEIRFQAYPVLEAKEVIEYRVVTEAATTGDTRFRVKMNSDLLKTPVPEEESTQVY
ncbi:MAG: DUF7507 domain-containing protein [Coraliomargaritaceae bacterium]